MTRDIRFYADSADVDQVAPLLADGLIAGVTTNPTILERGGRTIADLPSLYARWDEDGAGEIFFQAWGESTAAILDTAHRLAALGPKIVVKVPATRIGFAAAATLVSEGTVVLLTAVYSQAQALAAATIGVRYIAPYLGRMVDAGRDGTSEIIAMPTLVEGTGTDVLAASLRTPDAIVALALGGVRYFTAAPAVLTAVLQHEVSDTSARDFEDAVTRLS